MKILSCFCLLIVFAASCGFAAENAVPANSNDVVVGVIKVEHYPLDELLFALLQSPSTGDGLTANEKSIHRSNTHTVVFPFKLPKQLMDGIEEIRPFQPDNCLIVIGKKSAVERLRAALKEQDAPMWYIHVHAGLKKIEPGDLKQLLSAADSVVYPEARLGVILVPSNSEAQLKLSKWIRQPSVSIYDDPIICFLRDDQYADMWFYSLLSRLNDDGTINLRVLKFFVPPGKANTKPEDIKVEVIYSTDLAAKGDVVMLTIADYAPGKAGLLVLSPQLYKRDKSDMERRVVMP